MLLIALVRAGVLQHNNNEANTYYINPPKGTTDNHRWAINTSDYLLELGFPAIPIRPAGNPDSTFTTSPREILLDRLENK